MAWFTLTEPLVAIGSGADATTGLSKQTISLSPDHVVQIEPLRRKPLRKWRVKWAIRALRNPADLSDPFGPPWVEEAVRDVTALGSTVVLSLITLAVAGFVGIRRQYHALGLLLVAVCGAGFLDFLLKDFFARPRPGLVPHLMRATNPSFPSGHSMLSAVVYLILGALLARLVEPLRLKIYIPAVAGLISFLVGLSRVYLGVHYPTDVLAGWTVGLLWAVLCWLVARALQRRGRVERAAPA